VECLDVTLERKLFHKPSANNPAGVPFLIGKTTGGHTIKGEMRRPVEFQTYRLWGEWRPQKKYPQPAFEFTSHEPIVEQSESGFAQYLTNFVDGLGPVKSRAIVDEFGMDALKVLRENPDEAAKIKGVTPEIVESIRKHFSEHQSVDPVAYARLIELFAGHKIPRKIINLLMRDWGSDAPDKVTEQPYILLAYPRLGWKMVDAFAVANAKYPPGGMERHRAALVESLERISGEGHTWGSKVDVESIAFTLVSGQPTEEAWNAALLDSFIAARDHESGNPKFALPKLAEAEEIIASRLATIARSAAPLPAALDDTGLLTGQRDALRLIEKHGVVIVCGAPGTGKSYTTTRGMAGLVALGFASIRFVAPTGKAAKRAAELLDRALPGVEIQSSTIHRALEPCPSQEPEGIPSGDAKLNRGREAFGFGRGPGRPLETQVLVMDEASMADVELSANLLKAVAPGTRLIIVGDPNQLPSVGPGSVLRDLIAAGIPTATLTEVQRNCGAIVRACHDIMKGIPPTPSKKVDLANGENWIHVELDDPNEIAAKIVALHQSSKTFEPVWEMQVISPERAKPGVGCNNLNALLSQALNTWRHRNPAKAGDDEDGGYAPAFVCGDKVVRTKNGLCDLMTKVDEDDDDYSARATWTWDGDRYKLTETDIVNGDMGDVVDICTHGDDTYVVVDFVSPHRRCRLPYGSSHLVAAYALTCHKAQGSGFPYVILPVHNSFYFNARTGTGLWNREMIYTMFSRAEQLLVTVGQYSAIEAAVGRRTVQQRRTRLRELVAKAFAEPAPVPSEPTEENALDRLVGDPDDFTLPSAVRPEAALTGGGKGV